MSDPTSEAFYEDAKDYLTELRQLQSDERVPREIRMRVREITAQLEIQIDKLTGVVSELTDALADAHDTWAAHHDPSAFDLSEEE